MKIRSILFFIFYSSFNFLFAQSNINKDAFKVWGNCDMCRERIEKSAIKAGASIAKWDEDSKILTVEYTSTKTNLSTIEKAVAKAGHDTQNESATAAAYSKLPGCCKYDRKIIVQKDTIPQ